MPNTGGSSVSPPQAITSSIPAILPLIKDLKSDPVTALSWDINARGALNFILLIPSTSVPPAAADDVTTDTISTAVSPVSA